MSSPALVKFRKDSRAEHRWRAVAANHEIVGAATEGYKALANARTNAMQVLASLKHWHARLSDPSRAVDSGIPPLKFTEKNGEHRWRIVALNSRIIGASSESFTTKAACTANAILLLDALTFWASERAAGRGYDDIDRSAPTTGNWQVIQGGGDPDDEDGAPEAS